MNAGEARAAALKIESALARSALPAAATVYRGLAGGNAVLLSLAQLEPGDRIGHDVFASTSRSRDFVEACLRLYDEPRYLVTMNLPAGARALDIAEMSVFLDEQEVLLQRGHCSIIRQIVSHHDYIELEVDLDAGS